MGERERHTDRQSLTGRRADIQAGERLSGEYREREGEGGRQTDRQTDRQTVRQRDR